MKRKKTSFILKICVLAFAVYVVTTLVSLQSEINRKQAEYDALLQKAGQQEQLNASLEGSLASELDDSYVEAIAHEKLGLVHPGEKVFIDISR